MYHVGHRIIEYPEWEETHSDHGIQLLAIHSTIQKSDLMSESVIQILLEVQQDP